MKKIIMSSIRFYQRHISPATQPTCRHHPTCSSYALEAVDKHGALKGGIMSTARILRCNPFVEGGVDRVPDYFTVKRNPANIGEQYIPDFLVSADLETKEEIEKLLGKYNEQLNIADQLPNPLNILNELADLKELSIEDLEGEFSEEELYYLYDIRVLPERETEDYQYFTLMDSGKNRDYLREVEPYDEGITLGEEHPLVVLEKTGIWYTNLPNLLNTFLIERGVTTADIENESYHLWMVLRVIDIENKK